LENIQRFPGMILNHTEVRQHVRFYQFLRAGANFRAVSHIVDEENPFRKEEVAPGDHPLQPPRFQQKLPISLPTFRFECNRRVIDHSFPDRDFRMAIT
jgi:hypothetical protein